MVSSLGDASSRHFPSALSCRKKNKIRPQPLKNFWYMGLHTVNAVAVQSGALWQGCLALLLISADMLLPFYARPYEEDWKDFVICFVALPKP